MHIRDKCGGTSVSSVIGLLPGPSSTCCLFSFAQPVRDELTIIISITSCRRQLFKPLHHR